MIWPGRKVRFGVPKEICRKSSGTEMGLFVMGHQRAATESKRRLRQLSMVSRVTVFAFAEPSGVNWDLGQESICATKRGPDG